MSEAEVVKNKQKELLNRLWLEKLSCIEKITDGFDNPMGDVAYTLCARRLSYINELIEDVSRLKEDE